MKKIITIFVTLSLVFTSVLPCGITAFAETERKQFEITTDGINQFDSWDVSDKHSGANTEGSNISFQTGEWTEYDLYIPKAGSYNIYVRYGSIGKLTVDILLNGEKKLTKQFDASGNYSQQINGLVGKMYMQEGKNTVRVSNASGSVYFRHFSVEYVKPFSVDLEGVTQIDAWNVTDRHPNANQEGTSISFQTGEWTAYELTIPKDGYYGISLTYAFPGDLFVAKVSLDGEDKLEKDFKETGGYGTFETGMVGRLYLEEGDHIIKVTNGGGSLYFRYFCIEYLKDIEVSEIMGDGSDVSVENTTVKRGTDSFKIKFNQAHNKETVSAETVKLLSGTEEIPAEIISDGETVTVNVKKTLDYEADYVFKINGVSDKHGFTTLENKEYTFNTSDADNDDGTASFEVTETAFEGKNMKIKGIMKSSAGTPIEGRKAEVYAITPSGVRSSSPECASVSGEDGIVILEGALKGNSESGYYKLDVVYEYIQEELLLEMVYVSEEKEKELADALKSATSESAVKEFFDTNKVMLGLNIDSDALLVDINEIYGYFVIEKPESFEEIREDYYKYLNMEKINQATDVSQVETVLADDEACESLGIIKGKIELLAENKQPMLAEIFAMDAVRNEKDFDEAVSEIIERHYAEKFGVLSPDAKAFDMSVDKGQTIFIDLGFSEELDNVTGATFILKTDDAEILKDCIAEAEAPFEAKVTYEGNVACVTLSAKSKAGDVLKMGRFGIVNTEQTGEWKVTISGKVCIDVDTEYDAVVPMNEKTVNVSAKENNSKPENVQSSSPSGSGRGNKGGGESVIIPDATAKPVEPDVPEKKYEFSDIENVEWAKESIYALLEKGVISESSDNKFNPDNNVTRAEFVKMLVSGLELSAENEKCTLKDVSPSSWYYQYVAIAEAFGLVTGDENGNFNPDSSITRQDMSAMIYRICKKLGFGFTEEEYGTPFADDSMISDYAKEAVYSMKLLGIINGVGGNEFAPKMYATRAQAAKIICETVKVVNR